MSDKIDRDAAIQAVFDWEQGKISGTLPDAIAAIPAVTLPADVAGVVAEADEGPVGRLRAYLKARDACDYDDDDLDYLVGETPEDVARLLASDIRALIALATAQAERIEGLQRTYDDLYADALADAKSDAQDFDGDLWIEVRKYLTELKLDWRDYQDDGILAEQAVDYIRECMNDETRRAEAAEADRDNLSDKLELERALTDGAHRRAKAAEAALAAMTKERDAASELALTLQSECEKLHVELAAERAILATIVSRCDTAKQQCNEGEPVSAFNLASAILGQIGSLRDTLPKENDK